MIRICDIIDPDLRKRVVAALAEQNDVSVAAIPEWYEMDEADYAELLAELNEKIPPDLEPPEDSRM